MKSKLMIIISCIIFVMLGTGCTKEKNNEDLGSSTKSIVFENDETEKIVRNLLELPTEEITKSSLKQFDMQAEALQWPTHLVKKKGVYKFEDVSEEEELKSRKSLETLLLIFKHYTNRSLEVEDIRKCVEEGNTEKNYEKDLYVGWYVNHISDVNKVINKYKTTAEYRKKYRNKDYDDLTAEEQFNVYKEIKNKVKK